MGMQVNQNRNFDELYIAQEPPRLRCVGRVTERDTVWRMKHLFSADFQICTVCSCRQVRQEKYYPFLQVIRGDIPLNES